MILRELLRGGFIAHLVSSMIAVIILVPTVVLFFPAMGIERAAVPALFVSFLGIALVPIFELLFPDPACQSRRIRRAAPGIVTLVAAVFAFGIGLNIDRFDAEHPVPVEVMYAMDTDNGKSYWVRPGGDPTGWSNQMVNRMQDLSSDFGLIEGEAMVGDAEPMDLAAPEITVVSEQVVDGNRVLELKIVPQRTGRLIYLEVKEGSVLSATAQGHEAPINDEPFSLLFHAPPSEGLNLRLTAVGTEKLQMRVMDGSDGLSGISGYVPRPDGVGILGSHTSELAVVARTVVL